ncbi:hypothetical protein MKC38_20930, partial [[Clostridium] innocuum]|nr:hypothetical protein [[Clostridium] innocuum]
LEWNKDYVLNEYDMSTKTMNTYPIKTKKGLVGGSVKLSETFRVGEKITATLQDAQCEKGSWTWERSKSLSSGWTALESGVDENSLTSTYTPATADSGYFIRATFTLRDDQDYEGSAGKASPTVIKEELNGIEIYTDSSCTKKAQAADMVVGTQLYAKLTQDKFDADVVYTWHHKTADGNDNDAEISGSGKSYLLRGKDVGLQIYVKATAKKEGGADGSTKATIDAKVKKAATPAPNSKPELVSREDISLKVKLPDEVRQGLYQFGYKEMGESEITAFDILTRGSNPVTITGLTPNRMYYIYVRQIGEDGYEDSSWSSQFLEEATDYPHVVGTVEITASNDLTAYGQRLSAKVKNGDPDQKGVWNWYRIDADGKRSASISRNDYYQIKNKQDIGMKIEAVFSGDSTRSYAGEINAFSEEVKKAEVDAPTDIMAENQIKATDSTLTFTLPDQDPPTGALGANERFIIGYSLSENGVPVEYREDDIVKEYEPKTEVTLKNLKRNTTYYLFLRYAEQDEHYKSDWSAVDHRVQVKTKETALSGTMVFSYAGTNAQKPVQGEKLVAILNAPNVKEGTWEWWRIKDGEETKILNFFPEGDDATYYMIP